MTPIWLLARREVIEGIRSKGYRIVLAVGFVAAAALVSLPPVLASGPDEVRIGVGTDLPSDVTAMVESLGAALDLDVVAVEVDPGAADTAIEADDLDAVVAGGVVTVPVELRSDDRSTTTSVVHAVERLVRQRLALSAAGLHDATAGAVLGAPPLEFVALAPSPVGEGERSAAALAGVATYIILIGGVSASASGVAEEKESRLVEVLLLSLRPRQLLGGKLAGIFVLSAMVALATGLGAVCGGIGVSVFGPGFGSTEGGGGDIGRSALSVLALSVVWLVPGIALYNSIAAALGATAERRQDAGRAAGPLTVTIVLGYLLGTFAIEEGGVARAVVPYIPVFAPTSAPGLVVTDSLSIPGAVLSVALVLAAAFGAFLLAARIYERSVTETGRKVGLREALLGR